MQARRAVIVKIIAIFVFFCFAECAAGSCINYGHACWGAHGKRSETSNRRTDKEGALDVRNSKWFLSKLIKSPLDAHYFVESDFESSKNRPETLFSSDEMDNINGKEMIPDDQIYDDNMLRLPKFLDKLGSKQI